MNNISESEQARLLKEARKKRGLGQYSSDEDAYDPDTRELEEAISDAIRAEFFRSLRLFCSICRREVPYAPDFRSSGRCGECAEAEMNSSDVPEKFCMYCSTPHTLEQYLEDGGKLNGWGPWRTCERCHKAIIRLNTVIGHAKNRAAKISKTLLKAVRKAQTT